MGCVLKRREPKPPRPEPPIGAPRSALSWCLTLAAAAVAAAPGAPLPSEATASEPLPARPTAVQAAARLARPEAAASSAVAPASAARHAVPVLVRQRLKTQSAAHRMDVALTLDACAGAVDMTLLQGLVRLQVPVTVFVTRKWLLVNPQAVALMNEHPELFQFENHGAMHIPPVIGGSVYGMRGVRDEAALREEVSGGTEAMVQVLRKPARWYRGAGAHYDARSLEIIDSMGYRVAGFSLNGDDGATLSAEGVARRLARLQPGDIVLAHMNHPRAGTGAGLLQALPGLLARGYKFVRLADAEGLERY